MRTCKFAKPLVRLVLLAAIGLSAEGIVAQNITFDLQIDSSNTTMPVPLTNNAVTGYGESSQFRAYSFGGIDSTLVWSGIRQDAVRYDPIGEQWTVLPVIPDTLGKIASAASTVKDRIYVIGGYHVLEDGSELSSDRVHVFDPTTDTWLPDGAPVPVPIDDHVQVVYKDSLIYVITGWSNTTNVADVQIYNPALDVWQVGTSVPNTSQYKVFGASGTIIGDTIYYMGGARFGVNFPLGGFMRKGIINPDDPTLITWSVQVDSLADRYRAASASEMQYGISSGSRIPFWFGGSRTSYNYNGIAYNGTGPVQPTNSFLSPRDPDAGLLPTTIADPENFGAFMDLRGMAVDVKPIAGIDNIRRIIVIGGMRENRRVWGKALDLRPFYWGLPSLQAAGLQIRPNITSGPFQIQPEGALLAVPADVVVVDLHGREVFRARVSMPARIDLSDQPTGVYHVVLALDNQRWQGKVVVAR